MNRCTKGSAGSRTSCVKRAGLQDFSVAQQDEMVAQKPRFGQVVGHEHNGFAERSKNALKILLQI